jgi:hypothetical protein
MTAPLLTTALSFDGETCTLTFRGCAESEEVELLATAFDGVHREALARSAHTVVADLRELEFVTSACLKVFVAWLQRVLALEEERRYSVRLRSDPRHSWQKRSLSALAAFATGVVEIDLA